MTGRLSSMAAASMANPLRWLACMTILIGCMAGIRLFFRFIHAKPRNELSSLLHA